jgi:hypothetical protein
MSKNLLVLQQIGQSMFQGFSQEFLWKSRASENKHQSSYLLIQMIFIQTSTGPSLLSSFERKCIYNEIRGLKSSASAMHLHYLESFYLPRSLLGSDATVSK